MSPAVMQLQVHLPGMHMVGFKDTDSLEDIANRASSQMSMLTEYFTKNREDPKARGLLYREFPEHYRWIKSQKRWVPRKIKRLQIGRLIYASPGEGERYYLRVLLNHVRGPTSFEAIRTVRGEKQPSFRTACDLLGLVETDKSLDDAMTEATTFKMPVALRRQFATIIVFCEYTDISGLWDRHFKAMSEDYVHDKNPPDMVVQLVLRDVADVIRSMSKDIRNYDLPKIDETG